MAVQYFHFDLHLFLSALAADSGLKMEMTILLNTGQGSPNNKSWTPIQAITSRVSNDSSPFKVQQSVFQKTSGIIKKVVILWNNNNVGSFDSHSSGRWGFAVEFV